MTKTITRGLYRKSLLDYFIAAILILLSIATVYPFWNVLILSLNDPTDALGGRLWLLPRKWTLDNFIYMLQNPKILNAAVVSVARTSIGALASVIFTAAVSYGTSKKYLRGQKVYISMILITMYIGGGLIPTFLVIKSIGLYQNFLVYIIPALYHSYYGIVMYSYFKTIPAELEESVKIDGGNDLVIFFKIIIPVSMPMMAAITLFFAVGQWSSWFDTLLYGGGKLMTLQAILVSIIRNVTEATKLASSGKLTVDIVSFKPTIQSVEATCMMITAIPIIAIYPFLQKYFVKGIMIGSLKG